MSSSAYAIILKMKGIFQINRIKYTFSSAYQPGMTSHSQLMQGYQPGYVDQKYMKHTEYMAYSISPQADIG